MTARIVIAVVAVAGAALFAGVGGGEDGYHVRLQLDNGGGLRDGSPVTIGGVKAGTVSLELGNGDTVVADLAIDEAHAPVGKDASAAISAVNLLGQKRVELDTGSRGEPAPSGLVIPASRVMTSTDLDQVLSVLDADTRTRLTVLINEAGTAFDGRREDLSRLLDEVPNSLVSGTALLNNLVADNDTLAHLLERTDGFVGEMAARRRNVTRLIDVAGQAAGTASARRAELRQTLAATPGTLVTLQGFLGDLRRTTVPLGPAARDIAAAAPALSATLHELEPFRRAATPALGEARRVAPELTRLARGATPVLDRAQPTARALAGFSTSMVPVSDALDHSIDNILAVVENWSRAIQFRDGLSHVFRGEASIDPATLRDLIGDLDRSKRRRGTKRRPPQVKAPEVRPPARSETPKLPRVELPDAQAILDDVLNGRTPEIGKPDLDPLLDYLLG